MEKLHNEDLHNLRSSQNIRAVKSRKMRWTRDEKWIQYFSLKFQRKRPHVRHRRRWVDNIKINI
jgi:hypothetical protein